MSALDSRHLKNRIRNIVLTGILLFPWVVLVIGCFSFIERVTLSFQGEVTDMVNIFLSFDFVISIFIWPLVVYSASKYEGSENA